MAKKNTKETVMSVVNALLTVIQILIGLKIILQLFDANQVAFVQWIQSLSDPLLDPFENIFAPVVFGDGYVLNLSALFALLVYSAVGYVIIRLLGIAMKK